MSMVLGELIAALEELQGVYGDDVEVRLMTQENWPFENHIRGVTSSSVIQDDKDEGSDLPEVDENGVEIEKEVPEIIYLVEGGQICYGNKNAWNCV